MQDDEAEIRQQKCRHAWAIIAEQEARLHRRNTKIAKMKPKCDELAKIVETLREKLDEIKGAMEAEQNDQNTYESRKSVKADELLQQVELKNY